MKNMSGKIRALLALVMALTMLLSGSAVMAEDAAAPQAEDASTVLATVNGEEITLGQVQEIYEQIVAYYSQQGYDMTDPQNMEIARQMAMSAMIEQTVGNQKAHELGLDVFTAEEEAALVRENDAMWEEAVASYIDNMTDLDENATEDQIAAERLNTINYFRPTGYTVEGTLAVSRQEMITDRLTAAVAGEPGITDEEVRSAYDAMVEEDKATYEDNVLQYEYATQYMGQVPLYRPAGYRSVYHILLTVDEALLEKYTTLAARWEEQAEAQDDDSEPTEGAPAETAEPQAQVTWQEVEDARLAVIASVQDKIDEIHAALDAGTPFLELAEQYTADTAMLEEPARTTGYEVHPESFIYDAAFTLGAFSMEQPGDVSEPVVSSFGVHILYYNRDLPSVEEPTEADLEELRVYLTENRQSEAYTAAVDAWMDAAEILYTPAGEFWRVLPVEAEDDGDE